MPKDKDTIEDARQQLNERLKFLARVEVEYEAAKVRIEAIDKQLASWGFTEPFEASVGAADADLTRQEQVLLQQIKELEHKVEAAYAAVRGD